MRYLFDKKKEIYFLIITLSLLLFFFIRSIFYFTHTYDAAHHGLIFNNGLEILNGKLPYKEIFIQYGILHDLLNSFFLFIFKKDIIAIYISTSIYYFSSIFIIGLISKQISNFYYLIFAIFIFLFNHPLPELPWSNYLAFLFLCFSIYFFNLENKKKLFLSGFLLSLSILSRENFYYFVLPTFIFINSLIYYYKRDFRINFLLIISFLIPIIFFLIYLFINNLFLDWLNYQKLPFIYIESYENNFFQLFYDFINYFIFEAIFNITNQPQYIVILLIILFNFLTLIEQLFFLKNKNLKIIFICVVCLSSFIVSINLEIFRLYTSIAIGLPIIFFRIFSYIKNENKFILIFILLFISTYSVFFFPKGNIKHYNNINFQDSYTNKNFKFFKFQKWEKHDWELLNKVDEINNLIINKCKINYVLNMTPNAFILIISNYNKIQITPHFTQHLGTEFNYVLQKDFKQDLINKIKNNNIIIYSMENNILLIKEFMNDYEIYKNIEIKRLKGTQIRVYVPKVCTNNLKNLNF